MGDLQFYGHSRLIRIMPVYIASFLILLILGDAIPLGGEANVVSMFIAQIFMLYAFNFQAYVNPVSWSLYVELIFYLLVPLYVACIGQRRLRAAWIALAIFLIPASYSYSRPFDLWPYFFWGILAYEFSAHHAARIRKWNPNLLVVLGAIILIIDLIGPKADLFSRVGLVPVDGTGATIGLGIAMFFILVALPQAKWITRGLEILPLRILGAISYSLYLVHPIYLMVNFPMLTMDKIGQQTQLLQTYAQAPAWYMPFVFFPGVLLWAALMFVAIERPFILWGRRLRTARKLSLNDK